MRNPRILGILTLAALVALAAAQVAGAQGDEHDSYSHEHYYPECVLHPVMVDYDTATGGGLYRYALDSDAGHGGSEPISVKRSGPLDASTTAKIGVANNPDFKSLSVPMDGHTKWTTKAHVTGTWTPDVPATGQILDDRLQATVELVVSGKVVGNATQEMKLYDGTLTQLSYSFDRGLLFEFFPSGQGSLDQVSLIYRFQLNPPNPAATPGDLNGRIELSRNAPLVVPVECPNGKPPKDGHHGHDPIPTNNTTYEHAHKQSAPPSNASPPNWGPAVVTAAMGVAGATYFRPRNQP